MEPQDSNPGRLDRFKAHFERNKKRYYVGSVVVVAGVAYVIFRRPIHQGLSNRAVFIIGDQSIITYVDRTGPPSYVIQCMRTGEIWFSQRATAFDRGISTTDLSQHLNGFRDNVNGETYRRLGLAAA